MASILKRIFEHNVWANLRLIDACAGLTQEQIDTAVPGTYGTIRDTFVHLVGAEERYLAAFTGERPDSPLQRGEFPGFADLRELARRSGERFVALAADAGEDRIVRGERRGGPFAIAASTFYLQAVDHATEHRTQVKTTLTQLGFEPPEIDGWVYDDEAPLDG